MGELKSLVDAAVDKRFKFMEANGGLTPNVVLADTETMGALLKLHGHYASVPGSVDSLFMGAEICLSHDVEGSEWFYVSEQEVFDTEGERTVRASVLVEEFRRLARSPSVWPSFVQSEESRFFRWLKAAGFWKRAVYHLSFGTLTLGHRK